MGVAALSGFNCQYNAFRLYYIIYNYIATIVLVKWHKDFERKTMYTKYFNSRILPTTNAPVVTVMQRVALNDNSFRKWLQHKWRIPHSEKEYCNTHEESSYLKKIIVTHMDHYPI